jgi:hypothetical protein
MKWAGIAERAVVGMTVRSFSVLGLSAGAGLALAALISGCATSQLQALAPIPPEAPDYVKVPHPEGTDLGDLMAVFTDRNAPDPASLKGCDADFRKLAKLTASREENEQGVRELVRRDPVKYHWCFYGKLLELEQGLQAEAYIDEKQKSVLDVYAFASPVARAFNDEFRDSRYLRWAISRYRRLSEYVFYRKLELSPQMAQELGGTMNPWGLLRPQTAELPGSVLEKYGILKQPGIATGSAPEAADAASEPVAAVPAVEADGTGPSVAPLAPVPAPAPVAAQAAAQAIDTEMAKAKAELEARAPAPQAPAQIPVQSLKTPVAQVPAQSAIPAPAQAPARLPAADGSAASMAPGAPASAPSAVLPASPQAPGAANPDRIEQ